MTKTNQFVFRALQVIAWIIFVGLCIEAGALLVNFFISLFRPEFISRLYQKLDLSEMYERSRWTFFSMYSYILVISILKAYLFYVVIRLQYKLDILNPFTKLVSNEIFRISYYTAAIGLLSFMARETTRILSNRGYEVDGLDNFWADSQAFILMAAIVYIIAIIIKRGIEIQSENELTV